VVETIDGLPKGALDDFHGHRIKNYNHIYYCYRCVRSFDSKKEIQTCKFCGAAVRDITGTKFEHPFAQKYRYYCTKCEKNFESFTVFENCAICGNKIIHVYKWEELGTWEKIMVRVKKIIQPSGRTNEDKIEGKVSILDKIKLSFTFKQKEQEEMPSR